jgi:hypothetical protein
MAETPGPARRRRAPVQDGTPERTGKWSGGGRSASRRFQLVGAFRFRDPRAPRRSCRDRISGPQLHYEDSDVGPRSPFHGAPAANLRLFRRLRAPTKRVMHRRAGRRIPEQTFRSLRRADLGTSRRSAAAPPSGRPRRADVGRPRWMRTRPRSTMFSTKRLTALVFLVLASVIALPTQAQPAPKRTVLIRPT